MRSFLPSCVQLFLKRVGAIAWMMMMGISLAASAAEPVVPQAVIDAFSRANAAVVGVRVSATEGSRSAETLGKQRIGSGVVIGPDGLILTIGYLMLEAQSIQITTQDNKTLPAKAVAYDLATGFGLIQPLLPLTSVQPIALGSLGDLQTGEPLMVATGAQPDGDEGDVNMIQLVSKRAFSGYWEYHIDTALFTSPPIANHSGAPLFNQRGELMGIGSLLVADALGGGRRLPGNMFVPVDLLKPILGELRQTGSSRLSHRPWVGLTSAEQSGCRLCASARKARHSSRVWSRAMWCWPWTAPKSPRWRRFTKSCGTGPSPMRT